MNSYLINKKNFKIDFNEGEIRRSIESLKFDKYLETIIFNNFRIECRNLYYDFDGKIDEKFYAFLVTNGCLHDLTVIYDFDLDNKSKSCVLFRESKRDEQELISALKDIFLNKNNLNRIVEHINKCQLEI